MRLKVALHSRVKKILFLDIVKSKNINNKPQGAFPCIGDFRALMIKQLRHHLVLNLFHDITDIAVIHEGYNVLDIGKLCQSPGVNSTFILSLPCMKIE